MTTQFDILRRPLVTEKTNYQVSKLHQYVFEVEKDATRSQVKDAVEKVFNVKVVRVNIINTAAKRTRRARSRRLMVRDSGMQESDHYTGARKSNSDL